MRFVTVGTSSLRRRLVELARPTAASRCGPRARRRAGRRRRPAGSGRGPPWRSARAPVGRPRERSNIVKSPMKRVEALEEPELVLEHGQRRRRRCFSRCRGLAERVRRARPARVEQAVVADAHACAAASPRRRRRPAARPRTSSRRRVAAAARAATARCPRTRPPGRCRARGPRRAPATGRSSGRRRAARGRGSAAAARPRSRSRPAARRRRTAASSAERARLGERVGEAVEVVVDRVEALPRDRRQHDQRARALGGPLGLRQARHRERPDRPLAAGAHPDHVEAGLRVATGSAIRSRPPIRLPRTDRPRRRPGARATNSTRRSNGPTCRTATEPAGTTPSGPCEREAARPTRRSRAAPARAVGIGAGATARLPAWSRTLDGERVVAVGGGAGAVDAGRHLAVPDAARCPRRGSGARRAGGRVVGAEDAELGRRVARAAVA